MVERFFCRSAAARERERESQSQSQSQSHTIITLLSGPHSCGKTSLLFQYALNAAADADGGYVVFICNRRRFESNPPSQEMITGGFPFGKFPMMYLGPPLAPPKWEAYDSEFTVDKLTVCVSCWSTRQLSHADRVQLMNSLLMATWQSVCRPKNYGGLGISNSRLCNKAVNREFLCAVAFKKDNI